MNEATRREAPDALSVRKARVLKQSARTRQEIRTALQDSRGRYGAPLQGFQTVAMLARSHRLIVGALAVALWIAPTHTRRLMDGVLAGIDVARRAALR
jgi:hypothetical protein